MSNNNLIKGECPACGGPFEFPAEGVGQTIECPHCGQPTELTLPVSTNKTGGARRKRLAIAIALLLAAAAPALILLLKKPQPVTAAPPAAPVALAAPTNAAVVPVAPPVVETLPPGETRTNGFAVAGIKLEKTPGSSLVYATGQVRNLGGNRRFGVKLELALFDTNDISAGVAKDYQPLMEPGSEWNFKALILESKAATARFSAIREDQ
jgi:hypothetical protein